MCVKRAQYKQILRWQVMNRPIARATVATQEVMVVLVWHALLENIKLQMARRHAPRALQAHILRVLLQLPSQPASRALQENPRKAKMRVLSKPIVCRVLLARMLQMQLVTLYVHFVRSTRSPQY